MLLSFDVTADVVAEHDRWHTHEHLPERLSIPGFLRGTRWTAREGGPRYMVLYEVAKLSILESGPYLERLNNPTPWTSRIMAHYRDMRRGFCSVPGSFGFGLGQAAALVRFSPSTSEPERIHRWLLDEILPGLPGQAGLGSAHLLRGALTPAMTNEQRIRGQDAGVDSALIVTGYDMEAVTETMRTTLDAESLARQGATEIVHAAYRLDYWLDSVEVEA